MAGRRRLPTAAERELFRLALRDAAPLVRKGEDRPEGLMAAKPADPPADAPANTAPAVRPLAALLATAAPPSTKAAPPDLPVAARGRVTVDMAPTPLGPRGGIDRRTEERVRRGRLPIDGRIDLHGMTQGTAHDALLYTLRKAHGDGRRLILVITGKGSLTDGGGVLRSAVPRWLHEAPFRSLVLAVHQAQPQHGGAGALYVFLKRRREP